MQLKDRKENDRQESEEGGGKGRRGLGCRVEGVKVNLGSYHPIKKTYLNSEKESDTETAQWVVSL